MDRDDDRGAHVNALRDRLAEGAGIALRICAALVALYVIVALVAAALVLRDEWRLPAWRVQVQVRGQTLAIPAATALRLATSPTGGRWLDGRRVRTQYGDVRFAWDEATATLTVECTRCTLQTPAFGDRPLVVPEVVATVRREGAHLGGTVRAGEVGVGWHAVLERDALRAHFALPPTPLDDVYGMLASQVPEASRARIEGTFALNGAVHWPSGAVELAPRLDVRSVSGLGTELLREGTIPGCGSARPVRVGRAWRQLREAAIAAEDQRFRVHAGYDLVELEATLARNLAGAQVERGASTITQQLARIVYTGGERTLSRKLRELLYAVEMERTLGKDRILDAYLAVAPWASGGCGAEAAARTAFAKPLRALTTVEVARLAGGLRRAADVHEDWRAVRVVRAMRGLSSGERTQTLSTLCAARAYDGCPATPAEAAVLPAGVEPRVELAGLVRTAVLTDSTWIPVDELEPGDAAPVASNDAFAAAGAPVESHSGHERELR